MKKYIMTVIFTALLLLGSCGTSQNSGEWNAYIPDEAHRLTIYTSQKEEVYSPVIAEFEERTGIWVEVRTDSTLSLLNRIESEQDTPVCDVLFGGGADSLEAYKHLFSPYQSSAITELSPDLLKEDYFWTPVSVIPMVLIYNPKLVRNNPPSGWKDLLDTEWRGNIAFADPELSGSAYTALATLLSLHPGEEEETLSAFYENLGGDLLSSSSLIVPEVANGNCYIGIDQEAHALAGIRDGYDLALVCPKEGTCAVPDGAAIISGAPHEENAKLFIDFLLSHDVQAFLAESCARRPVRSDIPFPSDNAVEPEALSYDYEKAAGAQKEILDTWHALTGEVSP